VLECRGIGDFAWAAASEFGFFEGTVQSRSGPIDFFGKYPANLILACPDGRASKIGDDVAQIDIIDSYLLAGKSIPVDGPGVMMSRRGGISSLV